MVLQIKPNAGAPDPFFTLSLEMLCTTSLDGRFQSVNPAFTKTLGYREAELLTRNILEIAHPEDRASVASRFSDLAGGTRVDETVTRFQCAGGSYKTIAWRSVPVVAEGVAYTVARDCTSQKAENLIPLPQTGGCVCALEYATDAFFAIDGAWRLVRVNTQAERFWKCNRGDMLGRDLRETFPEVVDGPFYKLYEQVMRTGMPAHVEEYYPHPPRHRWLAVDAYPSGDGLAVYFRDVSERRHSEERIQRALQEKEVLLREVHHRVKNNLQVICSMLRLQSRNVNDETLLQVLRDCRERVLAMAMLHDQLHRAKDFSNINLGEYIRNLAASLFCSYGVNSADIGLDLGIEDIAIAIDTAIPCGLLVNEIVSNSLRHAFPEGKGRVSLGLHALPGGNVELTVCDDGRGFAASAPEETRSLGLRLVDLLAEQIDATVERPTGTGTAYRLIFQATQSKEKVDEQASDHVSRG